MTPKIKTLIVEDDKSAANYLSKILKENFSQIDIVGFTESVKDSIKSIDFLKPEIVFMDIVLTDGNAFQILDEVSFTGFEVIFITSHEEYFKKAIEKYYAFHFTQKPINIDKIEGVIHKYDSLKERFSSANKYQLFSEFMKDSGAKFLVQISNQHIAINIGNIIKCVADGNYVHFYREGKKDILASKSLSYHEDFLLSKGFFKTNRSTLVNVKHIASIYKKETIVLDNGERITISRRNKSNLNKLIQALS